MHGKLLAIKENIDTYYPNTTELHQSDEKANDVSNVSQSNSLNNGGNRMPLKEILGDIIQSDNPTQAAYNKNVLGSARPYYEQLIEIEEDQKFN